MRRAIKKPDQSQLKPVEKTTPTITQPKIKPTATNRSKLDIKITNSTQSVKIEKSKVKSIPIVKQHMTNSQKTIKPNNVLKNNVQKVNKTQNKTPQVNKENRTSASQSKSGSNSSTQQSPSMINKNKQSSSNSTPSSQARSDSNPYSGSPSLRRSLLLAAKAPQIPVKPVSPATNKRLARIQASNSLTSPTKASAAKCVSNTQKTKQIIHTTVKQKIDTKKVPEKPMVERSGTFLKDEPTVLNKA